jgi:hypothetical protein
LRDTAVSAFPEPSRAIRTELVARFAVLDALGHHLSSVSYPSVAALGAARDDASEFVYLAGQVSLGFHRSVGRRRRATRSLEHRVPRVAVERFLRGRQGVPTAHDALRRQLRTVSRPLKTVRNEVAAHRARFADRLDYHAIFDAAAVGIRGWRG